MSEDDASNASIESAPSLASTGDASTQAEEEPSTMVVEVSPENEAKSLQLKDEGNIQLMAGHFLQAIGLYSQALELNPTNAVILSNRAQAFIKVENYGLAMLDATEAMKSDPNYAKSYFRRGSAQFALTHYKEARKDFRMVCKLMPKDRDARAKLAACEKAVKEEAFAKAIVSDMTEPLSSTFDPSSISLIPDSYEGPNPVMDGPTSDMDLEESLFEPGNLPREFVMVRIEC
jgi:serine/threonine-protein phosphatase 5